jgi:hypothetical protein
MEKITLVIPNLYWPLPLFACGLLPIMANHFDVEAPKSTMRGLRRRKRNASQPHGRKTPIPYMTKSKKDAKQTERVFKKKIVIANKEKVDTMEELIIKKCTQFVKE